MDVVRAKKKQAVKYLTLVLFCPRCRKKHPLKECPLDKVEVCQLCELNHDTKECPSLPQVKAVLQKSTSNVDQAYFIAEKKPWQPQNQVMNSDPLPFWNNMDNMNTQFP